jgi:hypothetical protein
VKVGDLVKWTWPGREDTGIIFSINDGTMQNGALNIYWFGRRFKRGGCRGPRQVWRNHKNLELLSAAR